MSKDKNTTVDLENRIEQEARSFLDELARRGAQERVLVALLNERREYLEKHKDLLDEEGHRLVVGHGFGNERTVLSGAGPLKVRQPRVNDKRKGKEFTSSILPPYVRRSPSVETVIPALYLYGVSTGNMKVAMEALLGPNAAGLSPTNVVRLKKHWEEEHKEWKQRDLSKKRYVYFWADGLHLNVRLENERPCLLVIVGTLEDGTKELVALRDGVRESKLSWKEVLLDLKNRGLKEAPELIVADGGLGLWAAKPEVFPSSKEQLCWVHKKANVLNRLPKSVQPIAKEALTEMYMAPTKEDALMAYDHFFELFEAKYPKACRTLSDNRDRLFTFYEFPAKHWVHLRSTNPIESTFATVRHRHRQTKGCGSRKTTLSMAYKLAREAEKGWRKINGFREIGKVIRGVKFRDGEEVTGESSPEEQVA